MFLVRMGGLAGGPVWGRREQENLTVQLGWLGADGATK